MFKPSRWTRNARSVSALLAIVLVAAGVLFSKVLWQTVQPERPALEITGTWWTPQPLRFGVRSISGRVLNNSEKLYSNVRIEFELFDSHGTALGTHVVTVHDLHADESREFETWALAKRPTRYRIRSVQGV